ncbi:MAG TPA: LysM peptidoglycan-binding domain-containing protein [Thermomicrobiaceae bacterium]|nr:LysM peptidoglycan-binding domain-containing protein [Thermomicrobiaceae bacterium]
MDRGGAGANASSCPLLQLQAEGSRCDARTPARKVGADYQARYCLTSSYPACRHFQATRRPSEEMWMRSRRRFVSIVTAVAILAFVAGVGFSGATAQLAHDLAAALGSAPAVASNARRPTAVSTEPRPAAVVTGTATSMTLPDLTMATPSAVGQFGAATPEAVAALAATPTSTPVVPTPTPTPIPLPSPTPAAAAVSTATPAPSSTAAPTPTAAGVSGPAVYTVGAGDTLGGVAARYGTTVALLQAANALGTSVGIQPGQQLFVPGPDGRLPTAAPYLAVRQVQAGESLSQIANGYGDTSAEVAVANQITDPNYVQPGWVLVIPRPAAATPSP